ncbi:glycosyl transferase group 1 [Rhodopirellula sallentina SM41]|uniref:Glycosyl transferase group 1 n=2 Tax=Rhodopirellula TaxID=265488 RepID=M5U9W1_9BACT|nr:glycosyl transferase group 1 [Rhodopirellula sallentina SM41]
MTWSVDANNTHFPYSVIRNPSLREVWNQHRWADVVYENNICLRLSWPAALLRKPSVVALRTWVSRMDGRIGFQDRLKHLWLSRSKGVIAVSERVRERCWRTAEVIGNPYRTDLFGLRPGVKRDCDFAFLGRLVSDKGADLAIRTLRELLNRESCQDEIGLSIIGEGPERGSLEQLATDLKVDRLVRFTGSLRGDALADCLNRHRFLWVPSRWEEPFGNVALEGMACGCIPIVSDGGGLPDAVGDAGLVFKRGDLNDMVAQSLRLLDGEDLCRQLARAAEEHLKRHVPQKVAERYLEVIEAAVAK